MSFLLSFAVISASGQSAKPLPKAPASNAAPITAPVRAPRATNYAPSKWYGVVNPGEKIPPLYPRDLMLFWVHKDLDPVGWAPGLLATGWEQLIDGDPKYGSDSAGFGERIGAAVLRDTSMRFFSDSLLPAITHEDPRYYRKAYGSIKARGVYAAERVFVVQHDDGSHGFNYSDTLGHLAAAAITPAYYPAPSANARVVMTSWALSLLGDAGGKLFLEFWPDGREAIRRRMRHGPN
ncbi:MAG TPA: hypothetical protein VFW25_09760 [Silvibacterium sp.]|nr:hypothetical protein [Silvibacterium sp.]